MKKNTLVNLNIASYFLNILVSLDVSKWFTTGIPINKTIKYIGLTRHHQKTVEVNFVMWLIGVKKCSKSTQEIIVQGIWVNHNFYQIRMNEIFLQMQWKKRGLRYTTHLINCHCHHTSFNTVCKSTVNLAFLRIQSNRTRIQKI